MKATPITWGKSNKNPSDAKKEYKTICKKIQINFNL